MKLRPIVIACTALFSAATFAGGNKASQPQAQSDQPTQQSSASSQSSPSSQQGSPQQASQDSETVKQAQQKLSEKGHDAGPTDGMIGPKTQAALKEFQQKQGMQPSGQLDSQTLAALDIDSGSASTGSSSSGSSSPSSSASGGSSDSQKKQE
jgi:peptidoglycan hydrolase-like protein with peptidoglycan-binding domain